MGFSATGVTRTCLAGDASCPARLGWVAAVESPLHPVHASTTAMARMATENRRQACSHGESRGLPPVNRTVASGGERYDRFTTLNLHIPILGMCWTPSSLAINCVSDRVRSGRDTVRQLSHKVT